MAVAMTAQQVDIAALLLPLPALQHDTGAGPWPLESVDADGA